jgi:elongation factor Ts
MAEITANIVKELREKTGAGMMDCKRALDEAAGDIEKATEILRKKGIASADKKAARTTKEGVIASAIVSGGRVGVLAEINCETDFVAKNEQFRGYCDRIVNALAADPSADLEPLRVEAVAKTGENIRITRFTRYEVGENGLVASYIHLQGKVGVLVEAAGRDAEVVKNEEFRELVKDLTLHIAASHPLCVSREQVPSDKLEKEREIYRAQIQGKPANIVEKIVEGKIDKYYSSVCLLDQAFVKDPDKTVADLLKSKESALGKVEIRQFVRYGVGEETNDSAA